MIGNAHIDPVWFWRWPVGVSTVLATCRSAADLLDEFPSLHFTRSDVWVYEQIEHHDPALFRRVADHIAAGRWHVVGGWYVQPDCNLPLGESFLRHTSLGRDYSRAKLGVTPTVGYNVDSFGHAASIPDMLSSAGFDSYVMMRPGPHEMDLPGSIFRWQGPRGGSLVTWRIHERYNCKTPTQLEAHIQEILDQCVTPGIEHVMCFFGVGDHGGGPTREEIQWIQENRDHYPGARLEFSHPRRFFDAVAPHIDELPLVAGELQYHAIGCYTVVRDLKTSMRRAESAVVSAEYFNRTYGSDSTQGRLDLAWRSILFNQFHDILAGSSIRSACVDARDQLGAAADNALAVTTDVLLAYLGRLPDHRLQRMVLFSATGAPHDGYVQHEPWLEWTVFEGRVLDEHGQEVPYQRVAQEAISGPDKQLLFRATIAGDRPTTYYLDHDHAPSPVATSIVTTDSRIANATISVEPLPDGARIRDVGSPRGVVSSIGVAVYEDLSDTWSHDIGGYRSQEPVGRFAFTKAVVTEGGPLRATLQLVGAWESSRAVLSVRLLEGSDHVEIDLHLDWAEYLRVAKLEFSFDGQIVSHVDGIPGDTILRPANGREFPIRDFMQLKLDDGRQTAVVCPDIFAADCTEASLGLTLCRSPAYAWQGRKVSIDRDSVRDWTDQGTHTFVMRLVSQASIHELNAVGEDLRRPPACYDLTRGMNPAMPYLRDQ
jgi:alpha-mannosidase